MKGIYAWIEWHNIFSTNFHQNATRQAKQGVCHTIRLAIYVKKYLKAKEELWNIKYFNVQRYNLQKIL
jgi:hypothetical protein